MSLKPPKFVWIAGIITVAIIVGYALFSGQEVEEVRFPGGGGARFREKPADEEVSFFVTYVRDRHVIEGDASVHLAGAGSVHLSVDRTEPFATATVIVPGPGTYAYSIEQRQVIPAVSDTGATVPMTIHMSGEGKIEVQLGVSFKVSPVLQLRAGGPHEWTTSLEPVRSEEERRKLEEEALKWLEQELGID